MSNAWFKKPIRSKTIILFWLVILGIFLGIAIFFPSLINRMRQTSYQETPYVNTPRTF